MAFYQEVCRRVKLNGMGGIALMKNKFTNLSSATIQLLPESQRGFFLSAFHSERGFVYVPEGTFSELLAALADSWRKNGIKNCPFCGAESFLMEEPPIGSLEELPWRVVCSNNLCSVRTNTFTAETAIEIWNRRAK